MRRDEWGLVPCADNPQAAGTRRGGGGSDWWLGFTECKPNMEGPQSEDIVL